MKSVDVEMQLSDTTVKVVVKVRSHQAKAPSKNFLDDLNDMYLMPDQVELRSPRNGLHGFLLDAMNIHGYFQRALSQT